MDPYAVLGVDRVAGPDEIDAAYARRSRLHDPAAQPGGAERAAAGRYHAELRDAYHALLGTAPPELPADRTGFADAGGTDAGASGTTAVRPARRAESPGRGLLVVFGTLVGAYVVIQVPAALGLGVVGLVVGFLAALALVAAVLVHEHGRES